jgi:serine/threonine-protein kinase
MTPNPNWNCDPEKLRLLLADQLPPEESLQVTRHLSECASCRETLETFAADPAWWTEVSRSFREYPNVVGPTTLVPQLDDTSANSEWIDPDPVLSDETFAADFVVQFLEPCDQPGTIGRLGDYEILEVIGRGGMSVVLKGYQRELSRLVAIKVMAAHLATSGTALQRFNREAKAAAAIVHANVMPIFSVCITARLPYLVMPLVSCESLQDRIDRQGPLDPCEILRIGIQVARGLQAAHAQGLVHRDVKPANVLLEKPANVLLEKGVDRVLLTDFGLARAADDGSLTRTGVVAGTPQYMSPEQAQSQAVDARSDLFSLGSVIYAMATGVSPFHGETAPAILRRVCDTPPIPMRQIHPAAPEWLEQIVARLHEKDPSARYQTAEDVAELLEKCLAHMQLPDVIPLPDSLRPMVPPPDTAPCDPPHPAPRPNVTSRLWPRLALLLLGVALLGGILNMGFGLFTGGSAEEVKLSSVPTPVDPVWDSVSTGPLSTGTGENDRLAPDEPESARPLIGPVIIDFHSSRTGGIPDGQSGVFYNDQLKLSDCHIDALPIEVSLPGGRGTAGMLGLLYNLRGEGVYNGWYIKPLADWSRYLRGDLVLVLRQLDSRVDTYRRTIGLTTPETECLRQFKVELKIEDQEGTVVTIGRPQFIDDEMRRQQAETGWFELRIRLDSFAADLSRVHELVLVFDNQFATETPQGGLAVGAVVLTESPGERITAAPGWLSEPAP